MEKCPLCSDSLEHIVDHIINCEHWNSDEPKDPVCSLCKKSVPNISLHFITHHSRPHKCKICHDRFFKRTNLIKHVKIHLRNNKTKYSL